MTLEELDALHTTGSPSILPDPDSIDLTSFCPVFADDIDPVSLLSAQPVQMGKGKILQFPRYATSVVVDEETGRVGTANIMMPLFERMKGGHLGAVSE